MENFSINLSNVIQQPINGSVAGIRVHSVAELECLVTNMNAGFKFAAEKYFWWVGLLFVSLMIITVAKALQGSNHKTHWFGERGIKILHTIESEAFGFILVMTLILFVLNFIPAFFRA